MQGTNIDLGLSHNSMSVLPVSFLVVCVLLLGKKCIVYVKFFLMKLGL